jgi:DNA polymerase elongation subunit (family B)
MTGHGSKLGRKLEQAIAALLTARNIEEAAKAIDVSPKTLQRWQKLPEFERAFREARMAAFRQTTARLQQASSPAVTTLLKIMVDPAAPMAVKARCAYYILDQTKKAIETEEIEVRVAELERAAEAQKKNQ